MEYRIGHIKFKFLKPYFIAFSIAFISWSAIGTIAHEMGHFSAANYFNVPATFHYNRVVFVETEYLDDRDPDKPIHSNVATVAGAKSTTHANDPEIRESGFYVTSGGPFQAIMTGTIGFIFLLLRRLYSSKTSFQTVDWMATYMSLFWLRETFNPIASLWESATTMTPVVFKGDEAKMNAYLNLPAGTLPIALGCIGLAVTLTVLFKFVPSKFRFTFILGGFTGSAIGFFLWIKVLGPLLFP